MASYIVATLDEIPPGGRKIVTIAGRSIGIFNVAGEYFALLDRCPHQGGPLCEGRLAGFLHSTQPGEYRYSRKGEILRCHWQGWEYDIRTGQSWFDPASVRVRQYKAGVKAGDALDSTAEVASPEPTSGSPGQPGGNAGAGVTLGEAPAPGLQPGPFVAETFPVSVTKEYVVVEIRTPRRVTA